MKKLMRNDPCWCGSKKPYCECHMNFDKKIEMYKKKFDSAWHTFSALQAR